MRLKNTGTNMDEITVVKTGMSKSKATVWFWSVVLPFASLWILLPLLFHTGYKPDVVELQLIAKEWVLATRKHPMLPAWILEILNIFTGRSFIAPFIAASLCTVITLCSLWRLARHVLSERLALIGTFSMLPFWSITVESTKYNQNSALMACWTLTILMFYNAFQTNKKRWWMATGLTLGLGLHAKYTMILLAAAILLYSLCIPRFRRYWKEPGPWLTVLISFAVFLPHLIWLYFVGFLSTASYALDRGYLPGSIVAYFQYPIQWLMCELGLILISPLALLVPCLGRKWKIRQPQSEIEKEALQYLLCCMAFPFFFFLLFAVLGTPLTSDYGYALYFVLGTYLLLRFQQRDDAHVLRQTFCWTSLAILLMVVVFIVQAVGSPYLMGTPRKFHFPMRELGAECDRIWSSRFDVPCPYISGDWLCAGNAAYAMKDHPSVLFYYGGLDDRKVLPAGTWATDDDVNRKGGILLWDASALSKPTAPRWIRHRFPKAEVLPDILEMPYKTAANIPPLRIGVALVPPSHDR